MTRYHITMTRYHITMTMQCNRIAINHTSDMRLILHWHSPSANLKKTYIFYITLSQYHILGKGYWKFLCQPLYNMLLNHIITISHFWKKVEEKEDISFLWSTKLLECINSSMPGARGRSVGRLCANFKHFNFFKPWNSFENYICAFMKVTEHIERAKGTLFSVEILPPLKGKKIGRAHVWTPVTL